jgi:hypothetical protein
VDFLSLRRLCCCYIPLSPDDGGGATLFGEVGRRRAGEDPTDQVKLETNAAKRSQSTIEKTKDQEISMKISQKVSEGAEMKVLQTCRGESHGLTLLEAGGRANRNAATEPRCHRTASRLGPVPLRLCGSPASQPQFPLPGPSKFPQNINTGEACARRVTLPSNHHTPKKYCQYCQISPESQLISSRYLADMPYHPRWQMLR